MQTRLLQDWTTVGGTTTDNQTISQPDSDFLDTGPFRDAMLYLQVGGFSLATGSAILFYDSAPIKDAFFFVQVGGVTITSTTLTVPVVATPLGRWLRWRLYYAGPGPTWNVTFRVTVGLT